jgi:hypothetical protein
MYTLQASSLENADETWHQSIVCSAELYDEIWPKLHSDVLETGSCLVGYILEHSQYL